MKPLVVQTFMTIRVGTVEQTYDWLNEYFDHIGWDIEKDEWTKMTEDQKMKFSEVLFSLSKGE